MTLNPGSSTYEGEAVDAMTPAGLPQEPSPLRGGQALVRYVNDGVFRAWRWIPPGVELACIATSSFPNVLGYQTKFLVGYFSYAASLCISSRARRVDARRR